MYNIYIDWDSTVLSTKTYHYGVQLQQPDAPTREGYTFTGWEKTVATTGTGIADSLSASAAKQPILLLKDSLSADQKEVLSEATGKLYIIGGPTLISDKAVRNIFAMAEEDIIFVKQIRKRFDQIGASHYLSMSTAQQKECRETKTLVVVKIYIGK